jgi:hypothetical protein
MVQRFDGPRQARDKTAAVMVVRLCSGTVDDFREGGLFGVQTHGLPRSTYDAFMYVHTYPRKYRNMNDNMSENFSQ